jgi:hypothetical protein
MLPSSDVWYVFVNSLALNFFTDLLPQLAYLVGLPPNEVPAVEIARGDLVEVIPASYGVVSRAFHFW